ncbi:MAG: hypothetical protein H7287_03010 [Thermoleophilia bacterium]|nr:hypothetical protein [Thermoleophilia bacterium]
MGIIDGLVKGAVGVVTHLDALAPKLADDASRAATKGITAVETATAFVPALSAAETAAASKADLLADFMKHAVNGVARPAMEALPTAELVHGVKGIAKFVKAPTDRVNDAIHYVKNAGKYSGGERNPDVFLHKPTGELYPRDARTGTAGIDSFGNLFDALERMPARWPN